MLVHAGSGIIKGFCDNVHFTQHPSYKQVLKEVAEDLQQKELWDNPIEEFHPQDPRVNQFFHRYSMSQIGTLIHESGFSNVHIVAPVRAPVDKREMELRMSAGAASMFLFGGSETSNIPKEIRESVVNNARETTLRDYPHLFKDLSNGRFGDPTILFVAREPILS